MISIIICSINTSLLNRLKENIDQTVGVPYEIIAIDNTVKKEGICKVYNTAARSARYPLLCFIHEDIFFDTVGWGKLVNDHLADQNTGLIGLAGSDAKSLVPSTWPACFKANEINIIQHYGGDSSSFRHILSTEGEKKRSKPVAVLDGVFLCTRADVFNRYQFDEVNLTGFHGYDIDYSLQVFSSYKLMVVFDILVHHYSEGTLDRKWLDSTILISRKWKSKLPVSIYPLSVKELSYHHWKSLQVFLQNLFVLDYNRFLVFSYYIRYSCNRFFHIRKFISMGRYIMVNMFGKIA